MNHWLDPLRCSLDNAAGPVTFFFRNDDAGWADDRLYTLLDLFERYETPIDLAVIPGALEEKLAAELLSRLERNMGRLGLHQHGYRHLNHEPAGRKCEFGPARSEPAQLRDLEEGKRRLERFLDSVNDPFFTPPWNRCTQTTVDCVNALGFRVLSRDVTASSLICKGLFELPVVLDWMRRQREGRISCRVLGRLLAEAGEGPPPLGVMLHHAVMDEGDRYLIQELLSLLSRHSNARCCLMRDLAGAPLHTN